MTANNDKQSKLKFSKKAKQNAKPFWGTYISEQETKIGGPYGVLDGEDLQHTKEQSQKEDKNGGRGGI